MSKPLDPGPPLKAGDEFCPCERPSTSEQVRAGAMGLLVLLCGATIQFVTAIGTGRIFGFVAVIVGLFGGWLVHRAAGRHRSVRIGAFAAGATLLAFSAGYGLLWLPFIDPGAIDRSFSWYYLVMTGLGAFLAYRLSGPVATSSQTLSS